MTAACPHGSVGAPHGACDCRECLRDQRDALRREVDRLRARLAEIAGGKMLSRVKMKTVAQRALEGTR